MESPVRGKDDTTRDVILELANVSGPWMANEGAHDLFRDGIDGFIHRVGVVLHEISDKLRNVRFSFAQRRKGDRENVQAV